MGEKVAQIFFLILLVHGTIAAQYRISGKAIDSLAGSPIFDAIITVKNGERIVAVAYSDSTGVFSINLRNQDDTNIKNFILECRHINYDVKRISLALILIRNEVANVKILMVGRKDELVPVEVKRNWQVKQNKDTISFNPEAYKSSTTATAAELFANIPGFTVKQDGKMLFNKKPVTALLIDGDNMAGENYGIVNQNLDARAIAGIELFNYEENAVLASIKKSDRIAVNIITSDDFRHKVSGNASVTMGNRGEAHASLFLLKKMAKTMLVVNANSIASDKFVDMVSEPSLDAFSAKQLSGSIGRELLAFDAPSAPDLPSSFAMDNRTFGIAPLGSLRLGQGRKITYRFGIHSSRLFFSETSDQTFFPEVGNQWQIKSAATDKIRNLDKVAMLEYRHNGSDKFAGKVQLFGSVRDFVTMGTTMFRGDIADSTKLEMNSCDYAFIIQYEGALKIAANRAILLNGVITQRSLQHNVDLVSNRFNEIFFTNANLNSTLNQRLNGEQRLIMAKASTLPSPGKVGNQQAIEFSSVAQLNNQSLIASNTEVPNEVYITDKIKTTKKGLLATASWWMNTKPAFLELARLDINAGVQRLSVAGRDLTSLQFGADAKGIVKLGRSFTADGQLKASQQQPSLLFFGPDTLLHSSTDFLLGRTNLLPSFEYGGRVAIAKRKLVGNSFAVEYEYLAIRNGYGFQPTAAPGIQLLTLAPLRFQHNSSLILSFRRFIPKLKGSLVLESGQIKANTENLVNQVPSLQQLRASWAEVRWISSFNTKLEFDVSLRHSLNAWQQSNENEKVQTTFWQQIIKSKLVFKPSDRLFLGYEGTVLVFKDSRTFLGSVFAEKKLQKKILLSLRLHNVYFNNQFLSINNSAFTFGRTAFRMVPPYAYLRITFQL